MAGMDVDSPPKRSAAPSSPRDGILQRLSRVGVPQAYLNELQLGLVAFVRENKCLLREIVSAILPTDSQVFTVQSPSKDSQEGQRSTTEMKALFKESLLWLQWLMFEGEPDESLKKMAEKAVGRRAVCGVVWGYNDLAYRCRTCEHDPTCAICVPCFLNGDHKDHDYSTIYTGGGCCDCGDVTAWKREGFCSMHKGIEQIEPLPDELASSIGPILDALFSCWREKLLSVQIWRHPKEGDRIDVNGRSAHELSSSVVDMFMDFSDCGEGLLSFISKRMYHCIGLLDVLVRAERFLDKRFVKKIQEMLLKFLGEPLFKYEFAKVFIRYYPVSVSEAIKEPSNSLEKYPLVSTFSVQIFTVPTLTPRLVREANLLGVLLGCLWDLLLSCVAEDGCLQASKWANLCDITFRLVEDIRLVMSLDEVPKYVACERPDISRTWIRLLSLVQGMDPQKRVTGIHTEEENETVYTLFMIGQYLGNVNTLLAKGAFSIDESNEMRDKGLDDSSKLRHSKVGKLSEESSACDVGGKNASTSSSKHGDVSSGKENHCSVPSSVIWLIFECLKAIENWFGADDLPRGDTFSHNVTWSTDCNILTLRKKLFRTKNGSNSDMLHRTPVSREGADGLQVSATSEHPDSLGSSSRIKRYLGGKNNNPMGVNVTADIYAEHACTCATVDDSLMEVDSDKEPEALNILSLAEWPKIAYDVSSQEISFHIPLHRLLSLLLRKVMNTCYGGINTMEKERGIPHHDFFREVLVGCHPYGFASFMMEHPLRLRVFCAQVRAGMWRKNGDAAVLTSECYRCVRWFEQGQESDLFLLQCCAALAPPDLFVERIQERFGLSTYVSLALAEGNEYEPVLVQDMLTLIIQLVKERRFCGSSTTDNLRRELIHKLASGDATHSQLLKSLPRDLSKSDQLQSVLDMLAVYSNPSGMKQGKYSLHKSYWNELDLYHPRWNLRDLQVAEERYFQFCKIPAPIAQLPQWTGVFYPFTTLSRLATSKSVSLIVRAILFYAVSAEQPYISHAPDGVLITALHLLSLALDICDKNQVYINKISSTANPSQCEGRSSVDSLSDAKDLCPLLTYACEEFDVDPVDASSFWKHQSILSLLVSLMKKFKGENGSHFSETRHCDISSLIESLLKKFAQLSVDCMVKLKWLAPDVISHMCQHTSNNVLKNLGSASDAEEQRAKVRERQAAIMEKMRAEQSKFIANLKATVNDDSDVLKPEEDIPIPESDHDLEESKPLCSLCRGPNSRSPLCYLVLLQKSRLTTFVERGPSSWKDIVGLDEEILTVGKEGLIDPSGTKPSSLVDLVQSELAYDIAPAEVDAFLYSFKERLPNIRSTKISDVSYDSSTHSALSLGMMEEDIHRSVLLDMHNMEFHSGALDSHEWSTTRDVVGSKKNENTDPSVLGVYIACLSREKSHQRQSPIYSLLRNANVSSKATGASAKSNGVAPIGCDGIYISSCGHPVHLECHNRYLLSLKQRYTRRLGFEGGHIVDPDLGEFLCPVCRRFANSILPVLPAVSNEMWRCMMSSGSDPMWPVLSSGPSDLNKNTLHFSYALSLLKSSSKMVSQGKYLKIFSGKLNENFEPALEPILRKLCVLYYPDIYGSLAASGRLSHSLILWDTLRYSVISVDIAARGRSNTDPAGSSATLKALYGELLSSNGFILLLLLRICQTTRSLNSLEVLMRFRGIQLLAGSICYGVSGDNKFLNRDRRTGKISSVLEGAVSEDVFPDIQFWKRAADPILVHDPFSSLMWVLFCLPIPFLSSNESFVSLVQLFYIVSTVQALITCYSKQYFDISCFGDCLLNDVCKTMGESEVARQYFASNYLDCSCHPKDMIRRLTFPYLRRCALLWNLIKSSRLAPFYGNSEKWEGSNLCGENGMSDGNNRLTDELNSIRQLEDMFQICLLEVVLKDDFVHTLALKWCEHFCEEFRVRKCGSKLYSTPAVPFRLMQLPQVYQDLLQRYVKLQCSDCKSVPHEPALCLLCGKLCSPSSEACCSASTSSNHAMICGAGIGVFLLVRKTTILLQRSARQAVWPSLYLDAFGEEDLGMSRGKPLYLSEERYATLTNLVASHGLDQSSEVLRHTTISRRYGSD